MLKAVLYLAILGGIYALVYYLNSRTPLPEGCENLKAECEGCHDVSCCNHPTHQQKERGE
ncbi:MAG: hypothetical protein UIM26_09985 [Longicatena sp.]|jgi:hypothetical protein|nr:hypothetical protein [Longicatena sp.]